jgi:formamidopyrimidine-DNA glycosylase
VPELPEVEATVRTLRPLVTGQNILRCEVMHPIVLLRAAGIGKQKAARQFVHRLRGQAIRAVERRGKFIVLQLDDGCIAMHFRLDGKVLWSDGGRINGHTDVAFRLRNAILGYVDPRHLGRIRWVPHPEDISSIASLGPDPLSRDFTAQVLQERLNAGVRPLKLGLMDPARIAGLGNIYSAEALWHARLDPRRSAKNLTFSECRRLHKSIVAVLKRALECCLSPAPDFRNPDWWFTGLEKILRVYGREGKPCRRCGERIRRFQQGGRSTFACLHCQK